MLLYNILSTGIVLAALHHKCVMDLFHSIPIPVLIGQPNTGKSFVARAVASLLGVHATGRYDQLTMAKMVHVLGESLFYFDDPSEGDIHVLKALITKVG